MRPLAYFLGPKVHYEDEENSPYLILDFPLKTAILHPLWRPVFRRLAEGSALSVEEISRLMALASEEKVRRFLDDLLFKGFLDQEGTAPLTHAPLVSIIIPVRNRPKDISQCLDSLTRIDYPLNRTEIIVVDDGSTDETPKVVSRFAVGLLALKEHRQASYCRNLAARTASGEILAFLDSDCVADRLWLRELVPAFLESNLGVLGGLVDSSRHETRLDHYEAVKSSLRVSPWYRRSDQGDRFFYVPSCNLLTPRRLFLSLGGFREDLHVGEDVDYCWRVQDRGYRIEYRPVGKVYHGHRNHPWPFCRRRFEYGTSEPLSQRLYPNRVKHLPLPLPESLTWGLIMLSAMIYSIIPMLLAPIIWLLDFSAKRTKLMRLGTPVRSRKILGAVSRSYFSFLFHLCSFFSRYYLIWALALLPLVPALSTTIFGMHLLTRPGGVPGEKAAIRVSRILFLFFPGTGILSSGGMVGLRQDRLFQAC